MGKCPSCGASSFLRTSTKECLWCSKVVCSKCVPNWHGTLSIKTVKESASNSFAAYETAGFCSDHCFYEFWEKVLEHAPENTIGTDIGNFNRNWTRYWNESILDVLSKNVRMAEKARNAVRIHSEKFAAFPWYDSTNTCMWQASRSSHNAKLALAQNLEKCGRTTDSARVFEELRQYDKARELREKDRHIIIKKTDVSVNLNALLDQIEKTGIVAVYRCPHCGGNLKIGKGTKIESLRECEHCGSEIETVQLADFLRTILS